jgi:hypothetical protein
MTIPTRTRIHRRLFVAGLAMAATAAATTAEAAPRQPDDPPTWAECAYRDHPAAADLGPILPVNLVPPPDAQAVLRGEVAVGTDCSIYDLPV